MSISESIMDPASLAQTLIVWNVHIIFRFVLFVPILSVFPQSIPSFVQLVLIRIVLNALKIIPSVLFVTMSPI